jgi:hypothetical protein
MSLPILKNCLLIRPKNQLSPLTLIIGFRCKIRLDNLEFRRIFRDFHFSRVPHCFLMDLKFFLKKLKGFFCWIFLFWYNCNVIWHFEVLCMKWVLFLLKFLLCKVSWSFFSHLLIWLPTLKMLYNCLLLSTYFFIKKRYVIFLTIFDLF